jgi:hypothetical protein
MVGKPVTVDAESLRLDPKAVRVLFLVHVPSFPKISVSLFVNGKGAKVLIVPELSSSDVGEGSPPLPPPQDKDKDKDKEDEEEKDQSDFNDSDSHWKRRKAKSSDPSPAQGAKDKAPADHLLSEPVNKKFARRKKPGVKPEKKKGASSVPIPKSVAVPFSSPASAPAPSIAQYGSNLYAGQSFAKKLAEVLSPVVDDDLLDISSDDGPHVSPDKVQKLSAAVREEIGWESPNEWDFKNETLAQKCKKLKVGRSFEGVAKKLDLASEAAAGISISKGKRSVAVAAQPSPSKSPSKVSKSGSAPSVITSTTPTSSTRRSSRSKTQDSESMLAKAVRLQQAKDNPGTSLPSSDFVLLASLPDDHLLDVASDSGLALVSGVGSSAELLSLVRAKEIAQAALAQAQVTLAEQKAAADAELAAAAQCDDPGPSVVQSPGPIGVQAPVAVANPCPLQPSNNPSIPAKSSRAKPTKLPKQVCTRSLRKTPARQARVSLRVSK